VGLDQAIGLALGVVMLGYLILTMLKPERF
jgi:K+-transporting ATPase KdpF subunit